MLSTKVIIIVCILLLGLLLYKRYENKQHRNRCQHDKDSPIRKYLLNESSLAKAKKPILWIHVPYEYNSRQWLSFGSRSSMELNQPYLYLTVKSIIKHCENDFFICIIDDSSFARILPDWNIDLTKLSDPILENMRRMALAKLIYFYGGMLTPIDFLCFKNLKSLYERGTRGSKPFICENVNKNITSASFDFYPDSRFMGAAKEDPTIGKLLDFMQRQISEDYTDEMRFLGDFDRWTNTKVQEGRINKIDGKEVGIKTMDNRPVIVDDLLSEDYLDLYAQAYGIWIPSKCILKRTSYEWFARLNPEQIMTSNVLLGKYILLASAPDAHNGVISQEVDNNYTNPDWVGFYKTPLVADGLYGLKPNMLGDDVLRIN